MTVGRFVTAGELRKVCCEMAGVSVSETSPFLQVRQERGRSESNCCVICVGSTGSGKSSTISIVTGHQVLSILPHHV